jgi:hypothetical protein
VRRANSRTDVELDRARASARGYEFLDASCIDRYRDVAVSASATTDHDHDTTLLLGFVLDLDLLKLARFARAEEGEGAAGASEDRGRGARARETETSRARGRCLEHDVLSVYDRWRQSYAQKLLELHAVHLDRSDVLGRLTSLVLRVSQRSSRRSFLWPPVSACTAPG